MNLAPTPGFARPPPQHGGGEMGFSAESRPTPRERVLRGCPRPPLSSCPSLRAEAGGAAGQSREMFDSETSEVPHRGQAGPRVSPPKGGPQVEM